MTTATTMPEKVRTDPLAKCRAWRGAAEMREAGAYPFFPPFAAAAGPVGRLDGAEVLNLGSNNYHGLTTDPRVVAAARDALGRYGSSVCGSRVMSGTTVLHRETEEELADFLGTEDAFITTTGYGANLGAIAALAGPGERVVVDADSHNSIHLGCRLGRAEVRRFPHNDPAGLGNVLAESAVPTLVVVEGVYSTTGRLARLPEVADVCRKHGAALLLDDAHGLGVFGKGRGTAAHFGVTASVGGITVTFSKSLASVGGAVAGEAAVVDYVRHHAQPLLFTAALPPASVAAARAALRIIRDEPDRTRRLLANARRFRDGVTRLGFATPAGSDGPIVPLLVGDAARAVALWAGCLRRGLYLNPVIPPGVPPGHALLRASVMATHEDAHLDRAVAILAEAGREAGIPAV